MFRLGGKSNRNVYWQPDNDPDNPGRLVCTTQTPEGGPLIVEALNALFRDVEDNPAVRLIGYSVSVDVSERPTFKFVRPGDDAP